MTPTVLLAAFAVLVVIAIGVAVAVMRWSGPRPDAPLKDMDADRAPEDVDDASGASDEESAAKLDRPGGPGQEPENPAHGDAVPGSEGDDRRG